MRGWAMCLAVALPAAAHAQSAPVTLSIVGIGTVHSAPDLVILKLTVAASGPSAQDARDDRDRKIAEIKARLAAIGVKGAAIEIETSLSDTIFTTPPIAGTLPRPQRAQQTLVLTLSGLPQAQLVRDAVSKDDLATAQPPVLKLKDTSKAHREAIAAAVAEARADAAVYAQSLGLQIIGIAKATNALGVGPIVDGYASELRTLNIGRSAPAQDVITQSRVQIEFLAQPK